jgi:monoamine oxidase
MAITRRELLAASVAVAALPGLKSGAWAAPLPRQADIVVIGAGAAGIAAARRIRAANRTVIVVEADSRLGGRCWTDSGTFGVPFDRGARWLHNPETNPMVRLARSAGLDISAAPLGQKIRIGRRYARAGETEQFLAALVRANRAIDDAARGGKADVACESVLPEDLGDWAGTVEFVLGANAVGKDLSDVSVMDKARAQDRMAAIGCRQGLGALMAKLAEPLPVALSTPARQITWNNREVSVETPAGRIAARAAIVTVSSNVLAGGSIRFTPDPKRQLEAAAKLSLGSYDRIALVLPGNPLGLAHDEALIEQSNSTRTALLSANIGGSSLCVIDVAGSFGRDLSSQGEPAMVAFAVEWLTKLFGSDPAITVTKSTVTRWNASPSILGAMSVAAPGSQPSRKILTEPAGNLFLAGEATHETLWGTVDGAWESGERAAEAALRKIGALTDINATPARAPIRRRHTRGAAGQY